MKFGASPDKQKQQGSKASAAFCYFSLLRPESRSKLCRCLRWASPHLAALELCTKTIPFFMQTFKNDFYSKIALTKDEFFNMLVTQGIRKATKKAGLTTVLQNRISSL